jgi:hypothetical protein
VNLGLRLAGTHTAAFRCGCLFAGGDVVGVAGWGLCPEHGDRQPMLERVFGGDEEPCLVTHRRHVRRRPAAADHPDRSGRLAVRR